MRRAFLIATMLLLASAATAPAQEWAKKMFTTTSHDFGNVAKGGKAQFKFTFKNIYEEPVHVASVRSSCSCTLPEASKSDLKTWETSDIVANFNTNAFLGSHSATITVTFDKPYLAEVQLQVNGNIRGDVVLQPGAVELGTIDAGQGGEKKISVTRTGRSDWTISDVRSANTNFEVEVQEQQRSAVNVTYDLTVRLKPTAPVGYINDQLVLVTNDVEAPQIPVDVEGRVVAEVTATPMSLSLGALAPGQSITKNIVVRSKRPLKITGVACDSSFYFQASRGGERNSGDPTHLHGWRAAGEVREEDQNQIGFGRKRRAGNYLPRQCAGRKRRNACRGACGGPGDDSGS